MKKATKETIFLIAMIDGSFIFIIFAIISSNFVLLAISLVIMCSTGSIAFYKQTKARAESSRKSKVSVLKFLEEECPDLVASDEISRFNNLIDEKEREIEKIKQETWLKEQKIEQEIRLKKQKLKQDLQKETNKNSKSQKKKHNKKMIKPLRIDQWKLAKVAKFKIYSYKQEIKKLQFREKARQKFREMRETISN